MLKTRDNIMNLYKETHDTTNQQQNQADSHSG